MSGMRLKTMPSGRTGDLKTHSSVEKTTKNH